jgi:16S rRNA (adenine1518-N6/adenine1519-N6)-dimethyltransferase
VAGTSSTTRTTSSGRSPPTSPGPAASPARGRRARRGTATPEPLLTRTQARDLLERHRLAPSRALGQNFVVDPNTVRRIARLADVGPGDHVVEVGAGLGALTLALVDTGAAVTTIEADRHLVPALEEVLADQPVRLIPSDVRAVDWDDVLVGAEGWALVANLPYNLATPIVLDVLADVPKVQRLLVMVQREVGERLAAPAGSKTYGIPSVLVALRARAEVVGRVSPEVFLPKPRVESALVRIERRAEPATTADPVLLTELVRQAFGNRRKMLRRSLDGRVTAEQFAAAGVAPDTRPEQLDVVAWGRLTEAVSA